IKAPSWEPFATFVANAVSEHIAGAPGSRASATLRRDADQLVARVVDDAMAACADCRAWLAVATRRGTAIPAVHVHYCLPRAGDCAHRGWQPWLDRRASAVVGAVAREQPDDVQRAVRDRSTRDRDRPIAHRDGAGRAGRV